MKHASTTSETLVSVLTYMIFQCKIQIQLNVNVLEKYARAYTVYNGTSV